MQLRSLVCSLSMFLLVACGDNGCNKDTGGTGPSPSKVRAPSPIGYSNVATLTANDVTLMAGYGLTLYQSELTPFVDNATTLSNDWGRVKDAVAASRKAGGTFFLTLVNWNGSIQRSQSTEWFRAQVDRAVSEIGPAGVWLEGVSEPDESAKAREWAAYAVSRWPGQSVVNGLNGRGSASGGLLDWHYCDYPSLLRGVETIDRLHSTDCSPILASNLSEAQVKEVTRAAVAGRRKLMLYDTANVPSLNVNVVKWMGEALQGS